MSAAAVTPLSVSWREWLGGEGWHEGRWVGAPFDAIVVGSGYGGSVAALRLAQKNYRVLLLERGSEYLPGEFPNDFSLLPKFFRVNAPMPGVPLGRACGLVEAHLGLGLVGVTGNGLGGGSLVNAGVVMRPDADVFAQPEWPAALRNAPDAGGLDRWFARARDGLNVQPWDARLPRSDAILPKTAALQRLGEQLGRAAAPVDATINPKQCKRCGDCASGCNVAGAKQSLDRTYLRQAHATGLVQIVTQAEVYRFEPGADPATGAHLWAVHAFATDAQEQFRATAHLFRETSGHAATARVLAAPMLFVCAGTFGSTQLLQRSEALSHGRLAFSAALGTRVSGNGDSLSWVIGEQRVGAVGQGRESVSAWNAASRAKGAKTEAVVGPTITAAIDLRTRADGDQREPKALPLEQRVVIEDGAVPRAVAQVFNELLATAATLKQLDGWWFRRTGPEEDPLAASAALAGRSQTLLAMGHDGSKARIVWQPAWDRSAPWLDRPGELPTYVRQQQIFDRFGDAHVHNPLWQPMPQTALQLMSGEKPPQSVITVHPLGGCAMADDPDSGVVDDRGRVWVRDPGSGRVPAGAIEPAGGARPAPQLPMANEPHRYRGLFVLDGAIVPTSLGCNPLWTITALAERALDAVACNQPPAGKAAVARGAPRTPRALPSIAVKVQAALNECLVARDVRLGGIFRRLFGSRVAAARLDAVFHTTDMAGRLREQRHTMQADATLSIAPAGPDAQESIRYQAKGTFDVLPAGRFSAGKLQAVACAAQAALLLVLLPLGALAALVKLAWGWLALVVLLWGLLLVVLPFSRTVLTWWILRGRQDRQDMRREGIPLHVWTAGPALVKQLVHACEVRVMKYKLRLQRLDACAPGFERAPRHLYLAATKRVMYRATIGELLRWLVHRCQAGANGTRVTLPLRRSLWNQVMDAKVNVFRDPRWLPLHWILGWFPGSLLRGTFAMGFDNLTASGLAAARRGAKGPIELGPKADVTSGMLALAGYPLLFLRYAFKTRLLDARLPSYSQVPRPDDAPDAETSLRNARLPPQLHLLQVPRGCGPNHDREDSTAPLQLQLRRYRQGNAAGEAVAPKIVGAQSNGRPVLRAKAVLLLHAFAQSGLSFTLKTVPQNLAEAFYAAGYEVWILESRMSTRSGYAGEPSSLDQIAAHDIPAAVRCMVDTLTREEKLDLPVQVSAFAQCLGAASLWMSALSGALRFDPREPVHDPHGRPCLSMLSHAMFSQVHPWIVGSRGTQAKTWLPSLLQALWRRGSIPFAVRGAQGGLLLPLLDRIFATMPAPPAEARRSGGHEDAAATCRRIRFIEAPLFEHENIDDATFDAMNVLFGDANLRLFAHARRFVDRERLVDEDGVNCYVTRHNLRRHLGFPVQLLHGRENALFDVRSAHRSFRALRPTQAGWQDRFCRDADDQVGPLLIDGYGHVDVLLGARAHEVVFPRVLGFFERCFDERRHPQRTQAWRGWAVRAPRAGPFVGWLRERNGRKLLRVSFVVDDRNSSDTRTLPWIRVRFRPRPKAVFRTLYVPRERWKLAGAPPGKPAEPGVQRLAWADLPLDAAPDATEWQLFTLHESWGAAGELLASPRVDDATLNAWFAARARAPQALGAFEPPLTPGHHVDEASTLFRVPAHSLASLGREGRVRFGVASCRHPGLGVDRGRVGTAAGDFLRRQPQWPCDFALLVGDQIYADATAGLVDPASPLERYHDRHAQAFDREGLGALLAQMPVYMTPDDHEWADGFPVGSLLVRDPWPDWRAGSDFRRHQQQVKDVADRAVCGFQRLQSPTGGRALPWYRFAHGCTRFFVIDSRLGRQRDAPVLVDDRVLKALARWLAMPEAASMLNVVACGSVVMPGLRLNADPANPGPIDTWQYAPRQREALMQVLVANAREGRRFLLLSGDYHVSGAGLIEHEGEIVGAAVVAPPLYAPMPYANASPDMVDTEDAVWLGVGQGHARFRPVRQPEFRRGSGVAIIEVERGAAGAFVIRFRRDLRIWERGKSARYLTTLVLPGPVRTRPTPAAAVSAPSSPAPAGP